MTLFLKKVVSDDNHHSHRRGNLKSYKVVSGLQVKET
jgi:hypothetical protein